MFEPLQTATSQLISSGLLALLGITFVAAGVIVLRHYVDY